jgi:hypothetical protein
MHIRKRPVDKVKGTEIPLQAWRDPDVSKRTTLLDFKTIGT